MEILIETPFETINQEKVKSIMSSLNSYLSLKLDFLFLQFTSDEKMLEINNKYLKHDYFTDIITFDLRDNISNDAEIYISLERVYENAMLLSLENEEELYRVCIHGMLHLAGFKDKTAVQKKEMRSLENKYLTKLFHVKQ